MMQDITSYMENPRNSLVDALEMLLRDNASGVSVTHDSIMGIPALRRATQIVSGLVGRIPVSIVKHKGNLNVIDESHPNQNVLRRPHKYYGWYTLARTLTANAMWYGNAYAVVLRDDLTNDVEAFGILDTKQTTPVLIDGILKYKTKINEDDVLLNPEDVLHIKNLGSNGLVGFSLLDQCKDSLGLSISLIKFSATYFKNNASLGTVVEFPNYFKDEEEIEAFRKGFANIHQGVGKAHKLAILQGGAKLIPLTVNNDQSQLLQSKTFDLLTISNLTGVSPHLLGSPRNTSFNSLEMEIQSMLDFGLEDWLSIWRESLEQVLLTEFQKRVGSHSISHDRSVLLKADQKTTWDISVSKINNGCLTYNEYLAANNLPESTEEWADWHRIPENTTYSELVAQQAEAEAEAAQAKLDAPPIPDGSDNLNPVTGLPMVPTKDAGSLSDKQEIPDDDSLRYQKLLDATYKRLNKRISKAYQAAYERREDVDIDSHIGVYLEALPDLTEQEARTQIKTAIQKLAKGETI